jgi:hypothetical protein
MRHGPSFDVLGPVFHMGSDRVGTWKSVHVHVELICG